MEAEGLVVEAAGQHWPLVLNVAQYRTLSGDNRCERAIIYDLAAGLLPSLPRRGKAGSRWRIPATKLLEQLGVDFKVVPISTSSAA